jgi:predicted transcriptional regulator
MEKLCNLLFELSNEDRLLILLQLKQKQAKIAHISKKLNFTVQETSRNISRLAEANLVKRRGDGSFQLTAYGENTLNLLPGFDFLSKHVNYFTSHTLSQLPHEFFCRIGDLLNCSYVDDVMITFYEAEKMMDEAEKFLWLMSDQHLVSATPHMKNALENGAKLRVLLPKDLPFPKNYFEQECVKEFSKVEKRAKRDGRFEQRWIDRIDTDIGVSDNGNGRVFFPTLKDSFDYKGFIVADALSHKFCVDLFEYYWSKASTVIPDQVLEAIKRYQNTIS